MVVAIYLLLKNYSNLYIAPILIIGMFVRETIFIIIPLWIFIKIKEKDKVKLLEAIVPISIFGILYLFFFTLESTGGFHMPVSGWFLVVILNLVPFIPFIPFWKLDIREIILTGSVLIFAMYALFFAAFDGRFLLLGYPIWIGISLKVLETKFMPKIKNYFRSKGIITK